MITNIPRRKTFLSSQCWLTWHPKANFRRGEIWDQYGKNIRESPAERVLVVLSEMVTGLLSRKGWVSD
jgi:hypothetical protein